MQPKVNNTKLPILAVIREADCIGCTKCIEACPADAILGSTKSMHTVIADECIGCKLCVAPCPVDCIDMVPIAEQITSQTTRRQKAAHFRKRYQVRQARLLKEESTQLQRVTQKDLSVEKKAYIQAAFERVKLKKKTL